MSHWAVTDIRESWIRVIFCIVVALLLGGCSKNKSVTDQDRISGEKTKPGAYLAYEHRLSIDLAAEQITPRMRTSSGHPPQKFRIPNYQFGSSGHRSVGVLDGSSGHPGVLDTQSDTHSPIGRSYGHPFTNRQVHICSELELELDFNVQIDIAFATTRY